MTVRAGAVDTNPFFPGTLVVENKLLAIGARRTSDSDVICVRICGFFFGFSTGSDTE